MKKYFILIFLSLFFIPSFSEEGGYSKNLKRVKKLNIQDISDLRNLTPLENIVVIQKKYLPKTFRTETSLYTVATLNSKFFYILGLGFQFGVYVRDRHSIGFEYFHLKNWESIVTKGLIYFNEILPFNLTTSQFFTGGYYKFSSIYGKFSLLNKKIVYFDSFIAAGGGLTKVGSGLSKKNRERLVDEVELVQSVKIPTLTLGTGQVFTYSRSLGIFWELKGYFYQFKPVDSYIKLKNLNFAIGVKYYFPKVSNR